jgi:hypothetical protein
MRTTLGTSPKDDKYTRNEWRTRRNFQSYFPMSSSVEELLSKAREFLEFSIPPKIELAEKFLRKAVKIEKTTLETSGEDRTEAREYLAEFLSNFMEECQGYKSSPLVSSVFSHLPHSFRV